MGGGDVGPDDHERARRLILVSVRVDEDAPLARYEVQAAHAQPGAVIGLDLGSLDEGITFEPGPLVTELAATAAGNAQVLVQVGGPAAPPGIERRDDLAACLRDFLPLAGKAFAAEITLPARIEALPAVRQHLSDVVRSLHGEADGFQAELLLDEMCLNAVENSTSTRNSYDVAFRCEGHEMTIEVTNVFDDSVDPARIMHRRLASFDDSGRYLGERGRGLFLIARMADGLQIRSLEGDRIRVSVTKRLRGEPGT